MMRILMAVSALSLCGACAETAGGVGGAVTGGLAGAIYGGFAADAFGASNPGAVAASAATAGAAIGGLNGALMGHQVAQVQNVNAQIMAMGAKPELEAPAAPDQASAN